MFYARDNDDGDGDGDDDDDDDVIFTGLLEEYIYWIVNSLWLTSKSTQQPPRTMSFFFLKTP